MSRTRPLRDAALAISLLTIVPTGAKWPEGERTTVSGWLPFVGLGLGGAAWAAVHGLRAAGWQGGAPLVIAALAVAGWAVATRLLHWDGLADLFDGLWGGHTPERRLEIMADSATGAFGATAIALVALVEVAAIGSVLAGGHERPLLLVPALARFAAVFAAWLGTPARPGGLGRSVMGRPDVATMVPALVVLAAITWLAYPGYGLVGVVFVAAGLFLAAVVPHVLSGPIGGVTGDVMGASVLLTEAALFAAAAILWGA